MPLFKPPPLPEASFSSPSWPAWHTSSLILQDCSGSALSARPSIATQLVSLCLWIPLLTMLRSLAIFSLILLLDKGLFEVRDGAFCLLMSASLLVLNLVLVSIASRCLHGTWCTAGLHLWDSDHHTGSCGGPFLLDTESLKARTFSPSAWYLSCLPLAHRGERNAL